MVEYELLTVEEVATKLRLRPSAVRRWLLERRLVSVHIGRLVRIPATEIDRIITQGTTPAEKAKAK